MNKVELMYLVDWLKGERFIYWKDGVAYLYGDINMPDECKTETFEKEHQWEFSRNRMIEKTIKHVLDTHSK